MLSKQSSLDSTPRFPAGRHGTIWHLSLFFLKNFTNHNSLNNFTVTTEIREKEVEKIFIKECYYEFLELEEREDNFLQLSIKGSEVNLLLVGTCVTWMEQLLQNNHKEVLTDKYLDYTLTYSRNGNFKKLFQFDGYTGLHSPDERINISESLNALQTKYGHKLDHWHSFEKMGDVIRL